VRLHSETRHSFPHLVVRAAHETPRVLLEGGIGVQEALSLPNAHARAQWARRRTAERRARTADRPPRPNAAIRVGLSAVIVASFISAPDVTSPPPVEAACGTNHGSFVHPPGSIKVLRTRTGKVQTVDFRRYVAVVMASGEWPTWMPRAALEAGAVATKQYAWYYTMRGNHRSAYRTKKGACYDVRDDVIDQLFKPEWADPTRKQFAAIDATWGLTLRKRGRFFLTGYRAGSSRRCAADADGWKLYAQSVIACARDRGWTRERIQRAYYGRKTEFVWSSGGPQGPEVTTPLVRLKRRTALHAAFATVSWDDATPGRDAPRIKRYRLQHRVGDGDWRNVPLDRRNATSVRVDLKLEQRHRFRVRARDRSGERSEWAASDRSRVRLKDPKVRRGFELRSALVDERGGRARVRFKGRSVAIIAPIGPKMGRAEIKVNGRVVARVDLERQNRREKRLVWTRNWGREKVRRVVVQPARERDHVKVDGFLVLR
jgi:Stage II sporulation protein